MKLNFIHRNVEFSVEFENDISLLQLTSLIEVELDLNLNKFRCIIVHGDGDEDGCDEYNSIDDINTGVRPMKHEDSVFYIKKYSIYEEYTPKINCYICNKNNELCNNCKRITISDLGLLDNDSIIVNIDYMDCYLWKNYGNIKYSCWCDSIESRIEKRHNTTKLVETECYHTEKLLKTLIKIEKENFLLVRNPSRNICKYTATLPATMMTI